MEDEFETTGLDFDPEITFDEGMAAGAADLQEQLTDRLTLDGMPDEEIEALFDPAPHRGKGKHRKSGKHGKKCGTTKQVRAMPQIFNRMCSKSGHPVKHSGKHSGKHHTYARLNDPAPVRATVRNYGKKAKSAGSKLLTKVSPYIPVAVGLGTFYMLYNTRLEELVAVAAKNKDGTPVKTLIDAISYDLRNWNTAGGVTGMSKRLQAQWKEIMGGIVGGYVLPELTKGTKYSKMGKIAGNSLVAIGIAYAAKAALDDVPARPGATRNVSSDIRVINMGSTQTSPRQPPQPAPGSQMNTAGMMIGAR